MRLIPFLFATAVALTAACDDGPASDPLQLAGGGQFKYTANAEAGAPLLEGTFALRWSDEGSEEGVVVGTWNVGWAPGADTTLGVGPQVGSGYLVGMANENGVYLDLNPGSKFDYVRLFARVDKGTIIGDWEWTQVAGPGAGGNFRAANLR